MNEKYNKIIEKAIELCLISDRDELIYGNSFIEIGERSMKLLDPEKYYFGVDLDKDHIIHTKRTQKYQKEVK